MIVLKKLSLGILGLVCLRAAFAQDQEQRIEAIASALRASEYNRAVEMTRAALKEFPNNAQLWAMQGAGYAGEGNKPEALASYRAALKISPDYLPALHGAVQIEYDAGSRGGDSTSAAFVALTSRRPDQSRHAGGARVPARKLCRCRAFISKEAGALFDSQPDGLHAYAACLVKLKQFDRAAEVFQRTLALKPEDGRERRLLAAIQLMAHQPQDALATLQPMLRGSNPEAATLELAATAYEDSKDTPQAVATLRQAILLDPQNVNLYVEFANLSSAHDSFQVGIDVVSDGIGQRPKAAPLYLARGVLYVQLGQYDKAEADFETAHELDPQQSLTSAAQGLLAEQENDLDHALATVQSRLAHKPNDPVLLYLRADFLSQKGRRAGHARLSVGDAIGQGSRLLAAGARAAPGPCWRSSICRPATTGKRSSSAGRLWSRDPKDQTALYHLIQGLRKTGDTARNS